jgi:hypothetical protein
MGMQTDVKSVHTGGTQTNQALIGFRTRIKAVIITGGAGAGMARFLDASGGNILLELDTGTNSNMTNVLLPGEGILFPNGIWYTSVSVAPTGITVIYG